jgi:hypothetical protein
LTSGADVAGYELDTLLPELSDGPGRPAAAP